MRERVSKSRWLNSQQRWFRTKWLSVICLTVIASRIDAYPPPLPPPPKPSPEWCSLGVESIPKMCCEGYSEPMVKVFAKDPKFMHLLKQGNYSAKVTWTFDLSDHAQNASPSRILILAQFASDVVYVLAIQPAWSTKNKYEKIGSDYNAREAHIRKILVAGIGVLKTSEWSRGVTDGHGIRRFTDASIPGVAKFDFCSTTLCFDARMAYDVDGQQSFERWERLLQNDIHYFMVDPNGQPAPHEDRVTPRVSCTLYDSKGKQLCRGHNDNPELC